MLPRLRNAHVTVVALACAVILAPARGEEPKQKSLGKVYAVADLVVPIKDYDVTGLPLPGPINCIDSCACDLEPTVSEILTCEFEFMCQQPEERPCCQAGKCCPNGACCPNEACCPNGSCCKKADCCKPATAAPTTESNAQGLLQVIRSTVCPKGWKEAGGTYTIEYCPQGMGLVVCAPPDVQKQVAEVLDSMHKLMDTEIAVEVRLVTVNDETYQRLGLDFAKFLDDRQVTRLMDALQSDRHTNVMQAPKVTLFNGQKTGIQITENRFFVTRMNVVESGGQNVLCPVNESIPLGLQMAVRATLSADHKSVRCDLAVENKELADDVPMFPVNSMVTPVFEGGTQGQPVPFTQFIQQPTVIKRGVSKSLMIPDGGTAVLYAGKCEKPDQAEDDGPCAPLFDWIYDIVDLFSPPEPPPTYEEHLLVLVTPRVIVEHGEMAEAQPMPMGPMQPDPLLGGLADLGMPIRQCGAIAPATGQTASCPRRCGAMAEAPCCPPPCPATPPCPYAACPIAPSPLCPPAPAQQLVQLDVCILCMDPAAWDKPITASWADLSPTAFPNTCKVRLVTLSGRPATFMSGGQQAVPQVTGGGTSGNTVGTTFEPFGTQLTFVPTIVDGGTVQLELEASLSNLNQAIGYTIGGVKVAGRDEQRVRTTASLSCGKTTVMHCGRNAEGQDVMMMVAAHLLDSAEAAPPPPMATGCPMPAPCPPTPLMPCSAVAPPPPACEPRLNQMMAKYRQACVDGNKEKAAAYADCCLMIDPTCFAK